MCSHARKLNLKIKNPLRREIITTEIKADTNTNKILSRKAEFILSFIMVFAYYASVIDQRT